jgi:hypothetical protein
MSYLPPNPYAQAPQAFLPQQAGMGGQAFPPYPSANPYPYPSANPMNSVMGIPGSADPMAALQGLPGTMSGFPAPPAGGMPMGQDSFAPMPQGMPVNGGGVQAPASPGQPVSVFQHPSGGFADKNSTLSGDNFWKSWKGIATGVGILLAAALGAWALHKHMNAVEKKSITEFGDQVKDQFKTLPEKARTAFDKFKTGIKSENAEDRLKEFSKTFDCIDKNLEKELFDEQLTPITKLRDKYTEYAEALKTSKVDGPELTTEQVEALEKTISEAEEEYKEKIIPKLNEADEAAKVEERPALTTEAVTKSSIAKFGTKVQEKFKALPEEAEEAFGKFKTGINSENAEDQLKEFSKTFDFNVIDLTKLEDTQLSAINSFAKAHTDYAKAIKEGIAKDKVTAESIDALEKSEEFKKALADAKKEYKEKITDELEKLNPQNESEQPPVNSDNGWGSYLNPFRWFSQKAS